MTSSTSDASRRDGGGTRATPGRAPPLRRIRRPRTSVVWCPGVSRTTLASRSKSPASPRPTETHRDRRPRAAVSRCAMAKPVSSSPSRCSRTFSSRRPGTISPRRGGSSVRAGARSSRHSSSAAAGRRARRCAGPFLTAPPTGTVRWRSAMRPTAAVAYDRAIFESFVEAAGLHVQWIYFGYFPGSDRLTGQDTVILGH